MPKFVDHEAYRLELCRGCFELFARRGYGALTMRHIAGELGVSTGTLYHYFDSKEDLFRKMLAALAARDVTEAVVALSQGPSGVDQAGRLFAFVAERESYFRSMLFVALDYHRHDQDDPSDSPVTSIVRNYKEAIAVHTGFAHDDALATLVFSLLTGLVVNRLLDPDSVNFSEQAAVFKNLTGHISSAG